MMYGDGAYGDFAYGDFEIIPVDPSVFEGMLADDRAERVWLMEIEARSLGGNAAQVGAYGDAAFGDLAYAGDAGEVTGGDVTLRYATREWVSRVFAEVAYLSLPGVAGNYASTQDSAENSITGNIDFRMKARTPVWSTSAFNRSLAGKYASSTNAEWLFDLNTAGRFLLYLRQAGSAVSYLSTAVHGIAAGAFVWVRFTVNFTTGVIRFYVSFNYDPEDESGDWVQIGADVATALTGLASTTVPFTLGAFGGGSQPFDGHISYAELRDGIDGPVVGEPFDARRFAHGGTTDGYWTINQSGGTPARIVREGLVPGADPDNTNRYDGRLTLDIRIDRRIFGREGIGGLTEVFAQARLINVDGVLDNLTTDYALDGRRVSIWVGRPTDVRADFGQVFGGVIENAVITERDVQLKLSDGRAKLRRPIQSTLYAGSGGLEGGADLEGKPKPLCYGQVFNITPPLVDSGNLIYQVHDGAIGDVTAAYDRGVALVKVSGAPAPGEYQPDVATGTIKLGGTPAGTVTCDVRGAADPAYVETAAEIVRRILTDQAELDGTEIDSASLGNLYGEASQAVGLWIGTETVMVEAALNELLASVGAFGGFNRLGLFNVGLIAEPSGVVDGRFDRFSIRSLERVPLPAELDPICWRVAVGYQKNYTVQTDLAASVSAARRTFAAQPQRYAKTEDSVVQDRHKLARELTAGGLYALEADALNEAVRLQALWGRLRNPFRVRTGATGLQRDLGELIEIEHPRHGLAGGAYGRVIGHEIDARNANVTLTVVV